MENSWGAVKTSLYAKKDDLRKALRLVELVNYSGWFFLVFGWFSWYFGLFSWFLVVSWFFKVVCEKRTTRLVELVNYSGWCETWIMSCRKRHRGAPGVMRRSASRVNLKCFNSQHKQALKPLS